MYQQSKNNGFQVTFILGSQKYRITVPSGEKILEVALDAGVPIRFGCLYGDCGLCASQLLEGKVSQNQATGLTEEQKNAGLVLLCIATPLSHCTISIGLP